MPRRDWQKTTVLFVIMAAYGLAFEWLGFALATVIFLVVTFALLGERRPFIMLAVAVPLVLGFWGLMTLLGIHLSPGELYYQLTGPS